MSMMSSMGPTGSNVSGSNRSSGSVPRGYEQGTLSNFTPEQMQLFQQMFSQVGPQSFTSKLAGGDQATFDQMEAPALRQFAGLQGNLASRFSGMGSGARRSSGFQNASNQASSDFAQTLQSQRSGLQQQAIRDLMEMSSELLGQRPYEQSFIKKQMPFWQQLLLGINDAGREFAGSAGKAAAFGGF